MLVTPSLTFPTSAPIALGGTTSAAQVTATRGIIAAQVSKGSAVYAVLRWNTGLNRWEALRLNGAPVTVEPTIRAALGEASTEFSAIPASYYTALLTTSQPDGSAANLVGIAIQDAGVSASTPSVVSLSPDVTGASNANTVVAIQHNPVANTSLGPGDAGKVLRWDGTKYAAATPAGGATPSDADPQETGAAAPGVSVEYSRGDHVHDLPDVMDPGTTTYPSSVTVDEKGRVTAIASGTAPVTYSGTAPIQVTGSVISIDPATPTDPGSMSGADKTKLNGIAAGATNTPLSNASPADVGTASAGAGTSASRDDHVHAHGNQLGGSLHALASGVAHGFFSSSDFTKLAGIASGATATPLSNATPANIGTASAGAATSASRDDHVHALPNVGPGAGAILSPYSITLDAQGRMTAATAGAVFQTGVRNGTLMAETIPHGLGTTPRLYWACFFDTLGGTSPVGVLTADATNLYLSATNTLIQYTLHALK